MLAGHACLAQVLAALLAVHFHPGVDQTAPGLGQCLSVFFPAFAATGNAAHSMICSAAIPAARQAIAHVPAGTPATQVPGPKLLRYVVQLLRVSHAERYLLRVSRIGCLHCDSYPGQCLDSASNPVLCEHGDIAQHHTCTASTQSCSRVLLLFGLAACHNVPLLGAIEWEGYDSQTSMWLLSSCTGDCGLILPHTMWL